MSSISSLSVKREPSTHVQIPHAKRVKREELSPPAPESVQRVFKAVLTDQSWRRTSSSLGSVGRSISSVPLSSVQHRELNLSTRCVSQALQPGIAIPSSNMPFVCRCDHWALADNALEKGRTLEKSTVLGSLEFAIEFYEFGLNMIKKEEEEDSTDETLKQLHLSLAKALLKRNQSSDLSKSLKHFNDYLDVYRFSRQRPPQEESIAYLHGVLDAMHKKIDALTAYTIGST